jgi:membrane-bound lytic murein transglycosylase D
MCLLFIYAGLAPIISCCASKTKIQPGVLDASMTAGVVSIPADTTRLDTGSSQTVDSFPDKFSEQVPEPPDCSEIEFLMESALNACDARNYSEANILLKKSLVLIKEKEDADRKWPDADKYYNDAVRIITEEMPAAFLDSIPDEISMLVFQKQMSQSLDTLKLHPNDSIVLKKLSSQKGISYNFPIQWNDRVYRSLYFFTRGKKGPLATWLLRSSYYLPFFQRMFSDSGIPTDLAYLPLIESGFNPLAFSRKRASGIWQFIASTGNRFGLRINYWIDERRDPIKSTSAAISYLKILYEQFGDWQLAIAAYNCGENAVVGAIAKASSANFWLLSLPRETRNYVPEFISALIVAKKPECLGYSIIQTDTFNADTLYIDECINLQSVADTLGISSMELRKLNPHILHWCTPPGLKQVILYLPKGFKQRFVESFARHPEKFCVSWYIYQVETDKNLIAIAHRFKVSIEAVTSINGLETSSRLAAGQKILIPIPSHSSTAQAPMAAQDPIQKDRAPQQKLVQTDQIQYRIREGETVRGLARLFRLSAHDICIWNGIFINQPLKAGQILILRMKNPQKKAKETFRKTVQAPITPLTNKRIQARYHVLPDETLYSIARKLSVSISDLIIWNGLQTTSPIIFAGQYLLYFSDQKEPQ